MGVSDKLSNAQKTNLGKQYHEKEHEEDDHLHYHGVDKAEKHISVQNALDIFLREITPPKKSEFVDFSKSLGRVISADIKSKFDIPRYNRSSRDGFAIKIESKDGEKPAGSKFRIIGDVPIGKRPKISIKNGDEAVRVATGSFTPIGSNAVVMKEYCDVQENQSILVIEKAARVSDNILLAGEDIQKGTTVLFEGKKIYPQHIALMAMVGIRKPQVYRKPKVAFFSTGDELIDASSVRRKGKGNHSGEKTSDVNRPFIESMLKELGAIPVDLGIAKDDFASIKKKILKGLSFDALILSAGSSVGEKDYASKAAESINGMKSLVHGVAMRPSSPTALATYRGKPFIMLPGFPTSMIVSFFVFARPAILKIAGSKSISPVKIRARLEDDNFQGREGITNFPRVRIEEGRNSEYLAKVVKPTEAQFSSWLKEANGIGVVGPTKSSLQKGESLEVFLIGDVLQSSNERDSTFH
jgi:molybdopterin molybdotransferase